MPFPFSSPCGDCLYNESLPPTQTSLVLAILNLISSSIFKNRGTSLLLSPHQLPKNISMLMPFVDCCKSLLLASVLVLYSVKPFVNQLLYGACNKLSLVIFPYKILSAATC